jgi:hypothetical protein
MRRISGLLFFAVLGFSSGLTAQPAKAAAANLEAAASLQKVALKCHGKDITVDNVTEIRSYLQQGSEQADSMDKTLQAEKSPLNEIFSTTAGDLDRRILFLDQYEKSGFSAEAGVSIAKALATTDLCSAGYDCGGGGVGNWHNCSGCNYKEVSPRTNPRTCEYSCAMCCTYYGSPTGCATSCPSGDPC